MGMIEDFKKFALKGSVIDMSVGDVIGAAFGKIASAVVENIVMPPLELLIGGVHFSQLRLVLKQAGGQGVKHTVPRIPPHCCFGVALVLTWIWVILF